MDMYRAVILDHYRHPHNFGHLKKPDRKSGEGNVSCGDRIDIEITLRGKVGQEVVSDIKFWGVGCAISMASASLLTDKVHGMKIAKVLQLNRSDVLGLLGTELTATRIVCALLPLQAIHKALRNNPCLEIENSGIV